MFDSAVGNLFMLKLDLKKLQTLRAQTFNLPPNKRLSSQRQALTFVKKRGFVYFWRPGGRMEIFAHLRNYHSAFS